MKDRAYCKINLALNVVSEREDGYHELEMIMVPVSFYDELSIEFADTTTFTCNQDFIEYNDKNTVYKMVNYLKEKYGLNCEFKINLRKCVPTQAGLAGGSADAASALRIINRLCYLNLSKEEIKEACEYVGSDVLFTYYNRPAVVKGKGDKLEFFNIKNKYDVLLIKPRRGVKTKEAFDNMNMNTCDHPDVYKLKEALENGTSIDGLLGNSLEEVSKILCPKIKDIIDYGHELNEDLVLMSGSGSTVFIIDEKDKLIEIEKLYKERKYFTRLVSIL